MFLLTRRMRMAQLPHPIKTWHQYGEVIGHWNKEQMLAYGAECAKEVSVECIQVRQELERYKEREKTMGWSTE